MRAELSEPHLHESACGLQDEEHHIATDFVDVLREVAETTEYSVDWGAAGCGSCFHTQADIGLYWVAQNDATDDVPIGYGSNTDELDTKDVGDMICEAAESLGVDYSWNGSSRSRVILGVDDYYVSLEPGTIVEKEKYSGTVTGIVIDEEKYNHDLDYMVMDVTDDDSDWRPTGPVIARFDDRDVAKRFVRNSSPDREFKIRRAHTHATKDGDNLVQFEGRDKLTVERTSNVTVL